MSLFSPLIFGVIFAFIFFKTDATFFSLMKKYKKSEANGFESVLLNIKIDVFLVKKEHTFPGFPYILTPLTITNTTISTIDV